VPDLRFIDEEGLCQIARLLARMVPDLLAAGRVLATAGEGSALLVLAGELDRSVGDLRSRDGGVEAIGSSFRQRRILVEGVDGSSEVWQSGSVNGDRARLRTWVARGDWGGAAAIRSSEVHGRLGTFSAAALSAEGVASAWLGVDNWALDSGFDARAGADLVNVGHSFDSRFFDSDGEVYLGAEVAVGGTMVFDAASGEVDLDVGVAAFVGVAAATEIGVGPETARVVAGAEAGIGAGVELEAAVTLTDGLLDFDFGASAFLGVGAGFDFSLEVDLGTIGEAAVGVFEAATDWVGSLWP
jgi:hypothetical protein